MALVDIAFGFLDGSCGYCLWLSSFSANRMKDNGKTSKFPFLTIFHLQKQESILYSTQLVHSRL